MAESRDERVSQVLAGALRSRGASGRWLVVEDRPGHARQALLELGAHVEDWFRLALGGREASAGPPPGPFDGIVLRLPRGAEAFRMTLHLLASRLVPDGVLWVAGANDEGIRPAVKKLAEVAHTVSDVDARRHCRVAFAQGPRPDLRGDLEAWASEHHDEVAGVPLSWWSWPSLFAHGRLDPGTRLLLETLPPLQGRVLDFACGAGAISAFLRGRGDPVDLEISDVDALALHAARRSLPAIPQHLCDGLPTDGGPWDVIVSNPPLHVGKDEDRGTLTALAATAPHRLRPAGALWMVVQGAVPVARLLAPSFSDVQRVARDTRFSVWRAA